MQKLNKGFTLIELLVVIAIIGILVGIVVINISNPQTKAKDTAIKSALNQARNAAFLVSLDNDDSFSRVAGVCDGTTSAATDSETDLNTACDSALSNSPDASFSNASNANSSTHSDATNFCIAVALNGGGFACVDGSGQVTEISGGTHNCTAASISCQ